MTNTIDYSAVRPARLVFWTESGKTIETQVFEGEKLVPGNSVPGPAIVETADTTVVVHPGQTLAVDAFGNFELSLEEAK